MNLTSRQMETQGISVSVSQDVKFCRQTPARTS